MHVGQIDSKYDVIIVGAGPAGLFASIELIKNNNNLKIALIEKGKPLKERNGNDVMSGVGGAGLYSDGKLNFSPVLSHEKLFEFYSPGEVESYCDYVDSIFTEFGVDAEYYPKNAEEVEKLISLCKENGIHLIARRMRHVGSDKLPKVIEKIEEYLLENNLDLITNTEVKEFIVENNQIKGVRTNGREFFADYVIVAPGRVNARWMQEKAKEIGIEFRYQPVEVGVRVEVPSSVLKKYADLMYDSIFVLYTDTFDDVVRTFCHCPHGIVAKEEYEGFIAVNGHTDSSKKSNNSNFALLARVDLTEPLENTIAYAKSIAELSTTIGGNKPILQRFKDLKNGKRSTWKRIEKSYVKPTLTDVTPGDLSMALPYRIITNIKEGLERLERVVPGIAADSTLLYGPEIKLRSSKIRTDKHMETGINGLFVAGDGAGVSGTIVGAAVTGVIAARGILNKKFK